MNLTGKILKTREGNEVIVEKHDEYIHVTIDGVEKKYNLIKVFKSGYLSATDTKLQEEILEYINKLEKEKLEDEKKELEEARLAFSKEKQAEEKRKQDAKFGSEYHVEHLDRSKQYTYQEVQDMYKINIYPNGRGINPISDSIVLISSIDKQNDRFVYHDRWTKSGDYIYCGEGRSQNQRLGRRNNAIINAKADGKLLHLFIKLSPTEYYYQGIFEYVSHTSEEEKDENGNKRQEYKFRLRKVKSAS